MNPSNAVWYIEVFYNGGWQFDARKSAWANHLPEKPGFYKTRALARRALNHKQRFGAEGGYRLKKIPD